MNKRALSTILLICLLLSFGAIPAAAAEVEAVVTDIAFEVNGGAVDISLYNIEGYNYFKLRDIAALCDGTEKEFSVGWDGDAGVISLVTGGDYAIGADDLRPAVGGSTLGTSSDADVTVNGGAVALTAYNIDGYTYYKLRDLCGVLGITVTWNEETRTSGISTSDGATNDGNNDGFTSTWTPPDDYPDEDNPADPPEIIVENQDPDDSHTVDSSITKTMTDEELNAYWEERYGYTFDEGIQEILNNG